MKSTSKQILYSDSYVENLGIIEMLTQTESIEFKKKTGS